MKVVHVLLVAVVLLASGCANSQFLGARVPAYCQRDVVRCRIWAEHHVRYHSTLRVARLPTLQRYLQGILDRLVRANRLQVHPVLRLVYDDATTAHDNFIDVDVARLVALATEADVAGVLAHELVHSLSEHSNRALASVSRSSLASLQQLEYAILSRSQTNARRNCWSTPAIILPGCSMRCVRCWLAVRQLGGLAASPIAATTHIRRTSLASPRSL